MNRASIALAEVPPVVEETPEKCIELVRRYLNSRRPFEKVPEDEAEFFACALARLTFAPWKPVEPDMVAVAMEDHAEWLRTRTLPYYIDTWRELARIDVLHGIK